MKEDRAEPQILRVTVANAVKYHGRVVKINSELVNLGGREFPFPLIMPPQPKAIGIVFCSPSVIEFFLLS